MKWDQRFFNSLAMGGGGTSMTWVGSRVACRINASVRQWLLFAHRSSEPGQQHLLRELSAQPLLDFELRLGEGSGAALALSTDVSIKRVT